MKRREALQGIGTVFGFTIATPAFLGLLQGCQGKPFADWVPRFFGESEGRFMARVLDIILPETDTPGATSLGVHEFIDSLYSEALPALEKDIAEYMTNLCMNTVRTFSRKEELDDLKDEDIVAILGTYLKPLAPEVEKSHEEAMEAFLLAREKGEEGVLDPEMATFAWFNGLRDMAITAYRETEQIGENVLAYKPVPGEYIPCGDLQELTGGKAWSIGS